jgi:cytochrome c
MHRREIVRLLTGGVIGFYSLFARASDTSSRPSEALSSAAVGGPEGKGGLRKVGIPDLKVLGFDRQVESIVYSRGAYCVTTADGGYTYFLEANLRFKTDSSDAGPLSCAPVILPAGDMGDRAWVVFASPNEISRFIRRI